jgi:cytidyltransferase-like protein
MIVLYPGAFDLFHRGHLAALRTARQIAGEHGWLVVGVNSDAFMADYKRTPAMPQDKRVKAVIDSGLADDVVVWEGPEGQDAQILYNQPDLYVAGIDWVEKDLAHQLRLPSLSWFDDNRISLVYLRRTPGISTTALLSA